jgi:hypothetical protein
VFLKHIKAKIYCRWKRVTQFVFLTLLNAEEACSQGLHMHQEPSAPDPSGNLQHLQQLSMLVPQIALLQSTKSSTIFSRLPLFAVQQGCHIKPRVVERRAGPKIENYLCILRATRKQELSENASLPLQNQDGYLLECRDKKKRQGWGGPCCCCSS